MPIDIFEKEGIKDYQPVDIFEAEGIELPKKQMETPKQGKKSLLTKSADFAQKYINDPIEKSFLPGAGGGLLQGTANIVPGLYNLGAKGANLIPGVNIEEKKGFDFAPKGIGSTIGEIGSFFGPGILGKIPGIANIPSHIANIPHMANALKKAGDIIGKSPLAVQKALKGLTSNTGKSIGSNALLGAVMSPEQQGLGAALGAGGSALGAGLGYGAHKIANKLGIVGQPGEETIKGLSYQDVAPSVEAGERLGTNLRPSEATRNPFIAGQEGRYTRTSEAAKENVNMGIERTKSEKNAINKLLSTIHDKSIASKNEIKNLYHQAYRWNMKPELVNELKSDPIISDAFNEVSKDSAWQRKLEGKTENNYSYLDKVRKEISDKENKLIRSGEKSKAAEYTDARSKLTTIMDKAVPDYAKARAAAQKSIIRSNIEKKLGTSEINGKNFYKKIISNENKFNELYSSLKNVPEAQSMLTDMKDAWHSLINVEKPSTSSYQSEKGINQARGSLQKVLEIWNQLTGKKKNLESVKFIRSDKWVKKLRDSQESGDKNRLESTLSDIMGKIIPGGFNEISKGESE
jgi:hypothetical protein